MTSLYMNGEEVSSLSSAFTRGRCDHCLLLDSGGLIGSWCKFMLNLAGRSVQVIPTLSGCSLTDVGRLRIFV